MKLDGLNLIYSMMKEQGWEKIDLKNVETIMNAIYVYEHPYEIEGKPNNIMGTKSEGIEYLHKIMKRQRLDSIDKKTLEIAMYAVSVYERQTK